MKDHVIFSKNPKTNGYFSNKVNINMEDKSQKRGPKPKELVETTIVGLEVGRGENKQVVPPDQVYELASLGCSDTEIAAFFKIKQDTLRRNFGDELTSGREYVKIRLRKALFRNACDHMNAAVQIFLAKNILGMTSEPVMADANAPLPWNEGDDTDLEIGETDETTQDNA